MGLKNHVKENDKLKAVYRKWVLVKPLLWRLGFTETESGIALLKGRFFGVGRILLTGELVSSDLKVGDYVYCYDGINGTKEKGDILLREKDIEFTSCGKVDYLRLRHAEDLTV